MSDEETGVRAVLEHDRHDLECDAMIRRTAQQIAEAAEAAEAAARVTDDTAVERWVRLVVAHLTEVATMLGVSMLHPPHHPGNRSVEEYGRRIDGAIKAGGLFGRVQLAGERISRALDGIAGGTEPVNHATVLRELWAIVETLEVYGWNSYFMSSRDLRVVAAGARVDHHEQGADE